MCILWEDCSLNCSVENPSTTKWMHTLLYAKMLCRIVILSTELRIAPPPPPPHFIVAAMRDRASVNEAAMRTIKVLYNQLTDIGCFSHTLDLVGEEMNTLVLDCFSKGWIGVFSQNPKVLLLWRTRTGRCVPSYSTTRWWSRFEVINHAHNLQ